jgi:TrmH family RNA methyltransferase
VLADDREFAALAATTNPQGILCILNRPPADVPLPQVLRPPFVLVLDRVGEPGNLGTILRTAWAVGLQQVWFTNGTTDPFGPKAIRAGMGAQFALDLREYPGLPEIRTALQRLGLERLWLAVPRGGVSCFAGEFDFRGSGLVIGNEATGVTACAGAETVTIPMPGMSESLNAAQAATVLLFEAVRRGFLPPDPLPEPVRDR